MSQPCNFHFDSQSVFTLAQQSLCFPGACPYKFVIAISQQAKLVEPKLESVFTRAQHSLCFPGYHNDPVFLTTSRVTSRRPAHIAKVGKFGYDADDGVPTSFAEWTPLSSILLKQ